jgi:hypothetical protein
MAYINKILDASSVQGGTSLRKNRAKIWSDTVMINPRLVIRVPYFKNFDKKILKLIG